MKKSIFLCWILLSTVIHSSLLLAQHTIKFKTKEIHIGIGPSSYNGDLGNPYSHSSATLSFGLQMNREKKINGNIKLLIGSVTGDELDYVSTATSNSTPTPNTFFHSTFISAGFEMQYNILAIKNWKLYISQGIGLFIYGTKDDNGNSLFDQPDTRPTEETRGNLTINFPTQIGIKYYFKNDFAIGIQTGLLNPMTDNIDNLQAWGNKSGNDNILTSQMQLHLPIRTLIK